MQNLLYNNHSKTFHPAVQNQSKVNRDSPLRFLWLEVTNRCNLECVHCYANSGPDQPLMGAMSLHDWKQVLHDAADVGCKMVQFIGGEPTLYPHLRELISLAHTLDYNFIEVYTNGAGLTEPMCKFLHSNDVRLAFSLYGASSEVHDKATKRVGSHKRTVQRIRSAVDIGLPIRVGVNAMEENNYDVEPTKDLLKSIGISSIRIDRVRGIGRGVKEVQADNPMNELCGECGRGRLAVDPNGDVYPCVFSKFKKIGNIHEGLGNLLAQSELKTFQHEMRKLADERSGQSFSNQNSEVSCNPYCNPNCNPFDDCSPKCHPW